MTKVGWNENLQRFVRARHVDTIDTDTRNFRTHELFDNSKPYEENAWRILAHEARVSRLMSSGDGG